MNGIGKCHWNVYSLVKVSGQSMVNGRWPVANSRLGFINCRMPSRFNAIEGDNHTPCKSRIVQQIFSSFPDFSKTSLTRTLTRHSSLSFTWPCSICSTIHLFSVYCLLLLLNRKRVIHCSSSNWIIDSSIIDYSRNLNTPIDLLSTIIDNSKTIIILLYYTTTHTQLSPTHSKQLFLFLLLHLLRKL